MPLLQTIRRMLEVEPTNTPFVAPQYWEMRHQKYEGSYKAIAPPSLSDEANARDWEFKESRLLDVIRRHAHKRDGDGLLDVGCGTGMLIQGYSDLGFDVVGVDFSPTAVRQARVRAPQARFFVSEVATLDLGRRFSVITAIEVLLHIVDEKKWLDTLASLARHLDPSGVLVIIDSLSHAHDEHATHCKPRSAERYDAELDALGLRVVERQQFTLPNEHVLKDLLVVARA